MTQEKLLDPTGMAEREIDNSLSPRPVTLRGTVLGLVDNTKTSAESLLKEIGQELRRSHGVEQTKLYTKDYFGTPISESLRDQIANEVDIVITAVGDCGSCSAATVADGILFERAGIPAVSITSDSFYPSGRAMARVQGFPGFEFCAVQHPVASLNLDQLRERVSAVMPSLLRILGVEEN
ncbi:UGSC family (seleno)protein [Nesterenkonia sp. NBAIMH1]|uniref:UGSC family (seleno)protein n=1 Tax=Nesterenkonia sp. NBAIMH1 TaxID=2600320 RepID=UPI0011B6C36F|nr:UGSC family (seleno)protein [Nesterenkonia sp. NBAIMH1]